MSTTVTYVGDPTMVQLLRELEEASDHLPQVTLWVDPGADTGWATWVRWYPQLEEEVPEPRFYSNEGPRLPVCQALLRLMTLYRGRVQVGWEDFLLTPGSRVKHDASALKVIGSLELAVALTGVATLRPVPSSARNLALLGNKLHAVGWWRHGKDHANDAAAHLLSHLLVRRSLSEELMSKITSVLEHEEVTGGEG